MKYVLTLLLVLIGAAQTCSAAEPRVLRRGNDAEPDTLDPKLMSTAWENNIISDLFLGLTADDITGRPIPGAAESWSISPDGLVWTFKLRPNLKWSDGTPLTAADFLFGFQRLFDPKTAAPYASVQYAIKNAEAVNSGKLPLEALGVRAPDDDTVEITLEQPTPYLLGLMGHPTAYPIPRLAYERYGAAWSREGHMVSNGAFTLTAWHPHEQIKLTKNPLFYDAQNVQLDEVYYYPIEDPTVSLNRFRAHEIDANFGRYGFPDDEYDWIAQNLPGQAHYEVMLLTEYLVPNIRRAPFNDPRVRHAVSLCIDRDVLTKKVIRAGSVPAYSFVPPQIANYHPGARLRFADQPMEQRRAAAKQLLAKAGFGPSHPLTFEFMYMSTQPARRSVIGQSAMMKECGIIARPLANEPKVHYDMLNERDFIFATAAWGADYDDPQTFLYLLDSRSGPYNYGGYANPAFDALMDKEHRTLDVEERADILMQAEQIALDDDAVIPLDHGTLRLLVAPNVHGVQENTLSYHRSRWISVDRGPQ